MIRGARIDCSEDSDGIEGNVLICDMELHGELRILLFPKLANDFGVIAFARKVEEDDRLKSVAIRDRENGIHRFLIREMAMASGDPFLEERRSLRCRLEFRVVIRLESDEVTPRKQVAYRWRDPANVGGPSDRGGGWPGIETEPKNGGSVVVMRAERDGHVQKVLHH